MSQPTRTTDPQLGLTLALLAIQTEHPKLADLAKVEWTVSQLGTLYGSIFTTDADTVMAAYHAVLGGEPEFPLTFSAAGEDLALQVLAVEWRGARIQIRVNAPARSAVAA